jgi:hypothetical protein
VRRRLTVSIGARVAATAGPSEVQDVVSLRDSINNDPLSDTTRMLTAIATIRSCLDWWRDYGMNTGDLPHAEARFGFWGGVFLFMALLGAGVWFAINGLLVANRVSSTRSPDHASRQALTTPDRSADTSEGTFDCFDRVS